MTAGWSAAEIDLGRYQTWGNSISIAKEGNHGISYTSAVGPESARHRQNLLGGRNLLGDFLDDAI